MPYSEYCRFRALILLYVLIIKRIYRELRNPCLSSAGAAKKGGCNASQELDIVKRWYGCRNLPRNLDECQLLTADAHQVCNILLHSVWEIKEFGVIVSYDFHTYGKCQVVANKPKGVVTRLHTAASCNQKMFCPCARCSERIRARATAKIWIARRISNA